MQRDAYAALIRHRNARKLPVRIMQLNGQVFHENVMTITFTGYKKRRLALMTYTAGQDPQLPRLPRDVVVPTFESLLKIHQPHFMYQLLPLLSSDVDSFAAMQAVCASAGSPFTLKDRIDAQVLNLRLPPMCNNRDRVCEFFKNDTAPAELLMPTATRQLPIPHVSFQSILFKEDVPAPQLASSSKSLSLRRHSAAAFVSTHDSCSEAVLKQRVLMTRFFQSPIYLEMSGAEPLRRILLEATQSWHVMAFRRRVGACGISGFDPRLRAHMVSAARKENLLLYEKVEEGVFEFVH